MGRVVLEFFFVSSRRRHTRCSRDWSSDVCSSDLGWLVHNELLLRALLQHTLVKKLVPVAPEQELFAHCSAPFEDKAGPGGPLPGEIPGILNICDGYAMDMRYMCCEPIVRCPVDF